jgi:O-antigen/teichoic acid export membrane protein
MLLANESISTFCSKTAGLLQYVGYALTIFKIAIPLIIIIFGMMDFGKAVVSEKDEDVKKQAVKLLRRAIAGIIIFFIPTLVIWIFETVNDYSSEAQDFNTCKECLLHPGSCTVNN